MEALILALQYGGNSGWILILGLGVYWGYRFSSKKTLEPTNGKVKIEVLGKVVEGHGERLDKGEERMDRIEVTMNSNKTEIIDRIHDVKDTLIVEIGNIGK